MATEFPGDTATWFSTDPGGPPERAGASSQRTDPRYVIEAEIGAGGTAVVYRALDTYLGRRVALKVPRDGSSADRFHAETQLSAGVHHPALVPLYDAGRLPDGRWYAAMPIIDGGTFARRRRELTVRACVDAVARVARAVEALHGGDEVVAHGDPSPKNVLLGPTGGVWLIDLGAASRAGVGPASWTPEFLAPERTGAATPASDVYALGALLRWALGVAIDTEHELCPVVACATRPEPERRPSAQGLAEDLERWLAGELLRLHTYSLGEKWLRAARARVRELALGLVGAATLAVGGAVVLFERREAAEDHRREQAQRAEAALQRNADPVLAGDSVRNALDIAPDPNVAGFEWAARSRARLDFRYSGPTDTCGRTKLAFCAGPEQIAVVMNRPPHVARTLRGVEQWRFELPRTGRAALPSALLVQEEEVWVVHERTLFAVDRETGQLLQMASTPFRTDDPVLWPVAHSDGSVTLGNRQGDVWRVDLGTGAVVEAHALAAPFGSMILAAPPDGGWLAATGEDQSEVAVLRGGRTSSQFVAEARVIALAAVGERLAVHTSDDTVRLYDLDPRPHLVAAGGVPAGAWGLRSEPGGVALLVGESALVAPLPQPRSRRLHAQAAYELAIDRRDGSVWTNGVDDTVARWDPDTQVYQRWSLNDRPMALGARPSGGVLVATRNGSLFALAFGPERQIAWPEAPLSTYALAVTDTLVVAAGNAGGVAAWRWPDLTPAWQTEPLNTSWMDIAVVEGVDGERFLVSNLDGTTLLIDADGHVVGRWALGSGGAVAVLADGRMAVGGRHGELWVIDARGGQTRVTQAHDDWVLGVAAGADGGVATASWDGTLRLWTKDLQLKAAVQGDGNRYWALHRRGAELISLRADGVAARWAL